MARPTCRHRWGPRLGTQCIGKYEPQEWMETAQNPCLIEANHEGE